jgi:predicted dithiol-disulfide oxidoreductase (DUF899 family)
MNYPDIVSPEAWQAAHAAFLKEEKALGRARDALNARRRRLPMTRVERDYTFDPERGRLSLPDLFEGRDQLIVYFNMLTADHICPGCSYYCDHIGNLSHLHARRTTFAAVSRATLPRIEEVKARLGWTFPWYSCAGSSFYEDFVSEDDYFGLAAFIRKGDEIFQTYFTTGRGVEQPCNTFSFLDITPWGRQEEWEDSPAGTPQEPAHGWVRLHDEYSRDT